MRIATRRAVGWTALTGYIATIFGANWAIAHFQLVSVGFGLKAPAGVYFVGLAFTCRDLVQNILGRWVSVVAIIAGAALSALVSPQFALASGAAFLCSELADFAVYTPLLRRGWISALVPANLVGCIVDSVIFLTFAFHSLDLVTGQVVGKAWMTVAAVVILLPMRRWYAVTPGPTSTLSFAA